MTRGSETSATAFLDEEGTIIGSHICVGKENSNDIYPYYEDHGAGRPVVLIHGWPLSGRSWKRQTAALLDAGYRVITYDRRGFGSRASPPPATTTTRWPRTCTSCWRNWNFTTQPWSVSRWVAAKSRVIWAITVRKASVKPSSSPRFRLFSLKTSGNPEGIEGRVFDDIQKAITADRLAFLTGFLANFYNVDVPGDKLVSNQVVQSSWTLPPGPPKGTLDCVRGWLTDFRGDLKRIDIPTLVIHGDADRILPIAATGQRTHALIKGSRFVVIEGGPHGLTWTHAEKANRALLDFLGNGG